MVTLYQNVSRMKKNKNKSSVCGVSKMWTGNKKLRELVTLKILESFWTGLVT